MVNLSVLTKKGSVSQFAKPQYTKRGDDSSETCSDIVPYEDGLPPIGNIVLKGSPPPSARTHSTGALLQANPSLLLHDHPQMLLLLVGPEVVRGRCLHHFFLLPPRGEYVIYNLTSSSFFLIHKAFLQPIPHAYLLIFPLFVPSLFLFIITSWHSKHKEDTSATHPILLNKHELEVYPFLLHAFLLSRVTTCSFFLFSFLYISPFTLSSSLIFFLFFFRPTLSPFLFITLRVKRSPLPQAHP